MATKYNPLRNVIKLRTAVIAKPVCATLRNDAN